MADDPMPPPTGGENPDRASHAAAGLMRAAVWLRRRPSPRVQRILLGVSLVGFLVAAIAGLRNFPDEASLRWHLLLLAGIVGMPPTVLLNALELQFLGVLTGGRIGFWRAVRVTVIGSAANLLPIPGSTLVRVHALVSGGARSRDAVTASMSLGFTAVGASLLLAGVLNLASPVAVAAAVALGGGLTVLVGSAILLHVGMTVQPTRALHFTATGLESLYAAVNAVRLWLILLGLGIEVGFPAAFALTATGSLAVAVGFFPAALGIREALLGLASPLVGIPIAVGLSGAVVERILWVIVLAACAAAILVREGRDAFRTNRAADPAATPPLG